MIRHASMDLPARAPRVGDMVFARSRRWLVDEVVAPEAAALKAKLETLFPELMR